LFFAFRVSSLRLRLRFSSFCLSRIWWFSFQLIICPISLHTITKMDRFVNKREHEKRGRDVGGRTQIDSKFSLCSVFPSTNFCCLIFRLIYFT
jgi:hypothetical protein